MNNERAIMVYEKMETVCVDVGRTMVNIVREKILEDKDATLSDEQIKEISAPILETFKNELQERSAREAEEILAKKKDESDYYHRKNRAESFKNVWKKRVIANVNDDIIQVHEKVSKRVKQCTETEEVQTLIPALKDVVFVDRDAEKALEELVDDPKIWTYSWEYKGYCKSVEVKLDFDSNPDVDSVIFGELYDIAAFVANSGAKEPSEFMEKYKKLIELSCLKDGKNESFLEAISRSISTFEGKKVSLSKLLEFFECWNGTLDEEQRQAALEVYKHINLFEGDEEEEEEEEGLEEAGSALEEKENELNEEGEITNGEGEEGEDEEEEEEVDDEAEQPCRSAEVGECACPRCTGDGPDEE